MSACWASRPASTSRAAVLRALALVALGVLVFAAPASARRHRDRDSMTVDVRRVDIGPVHVSTNRPAVHGTLSVDGHQVEFGGDTLDDGTIPRLHHRHSDVDFGRGIHIESGDQSIVRMGSDIVIDSTEVVDDAVVSLFGNVTVRGHVSGDVVAVLGSVTLEPGSVVEGDAVAVGGALDQSPDAIVHGQSVSLSFLPIRAGVRPLRAIAIALLAAWVIAMLVGTVLALLLPKRFTRMAQTVSERTGMSLLFGVLLPPILVLAAVLLVVTLIGIPVAAALPFVYLITVWIGTVAAAYLLGCRAMKRELGDGIAGPVLAGTGIIAIPFVIGAVLAGTHGMAGGLGLFFPLLGVLLATSLAVIGSGAVFVSRFGSVGSGPRVAVANALPPPPIASAPPPPVAPATAPPVG